MSYSFMKQFMHVQGRFQGFNRTGAQFKESQRLGIRMFNLIKDIPNFYLKSEISTQILGIFDDKWRL